MASSIEYTPPSIQVTRDSVCYTSPASNDVKHGFLITTYMGDEDLGSVLEAFDGTAVSEYTLTACPIIIQNQLNDKKVVVLRDRTNQAVVYGVQTLNDNGTVSTSYFNIDGTPFTGSINNLELANDILNYSSPVVFCHNGTTTVTRTDVWDERQTLVAVIWQDIKGLVVTEPSGTLTPGSCSLPLDTEVIPQVDNELVNNKLTGRYAKFYRVNVHDNAGNVVYSRVKLSNGTNYTPVGKVSSDVLIPPVQAGLKRVTGGDIWAADATTQSVSFTVEYANSANTVEISTDEGTTVLNKLNYRAGWSVDGDNDAHVKGVSIKANATSKVLVAYTKQPELIEVDPLVGLTA
jgi:hypothetical protein